MIWADVRHHYEDRDDDPDPIPCPIADEIERLLDREGAPHELQARIKALVVAWEAGDEHQRDLAEQEDEDRLGEEANIAEMSSMMARLAAEDAADAAREDALVAEFEAHEPPILDARDALMRSNHELGTVLERWRDRQPWTTEAESDLRSVPFTADCIRRIERTLAATGRFEIASRGNL